MKTVCQMCERKRNCTVVDKKTKGLHSRAMRRVALGARLNICRRCMKKGKL